MDELEVFHKKLSTIGFEITLYSQLYGTVENINTLNDFNPLVFGVFQKNMYLSICLELAKLLDPEGNSRNKNLSIKRLIINLQLSEDEEIKKLMTSAKELYESSIKDFRNKVIAHNDYEVAMKRKKLLSNGNIHDLKVLGNKIYKLYSLLRFKSGKDTLQVSRRVGCVLPRDLDGLSFINKLAEKI